MTNYDLKNLLDPKTDVPHFEPYDTIDFTPCRTADFGKLVLDCADKILKVDLLDSARSEEESSNNLYNTLLQNISDTEQEIKIDPCDIKYMRQRLIGKFTVSGLKIIGLTLLEKGKHTITVSGAEKPSYGWLGEMEILHKLPGQVVPVNESFSFASLVYDTGSNKGLVFRSGPYGSDFKIGDIENSNLHKARSDSKRKGPFASSGRTTKTSVRSPLKDASN